MKLPSSSLMTSGAHCRLLLVVDCKIGHDMACLVMVGTHGVRVASVDPARQSRQCVLLRAVCVRDDTPIFEVGGFCHLNVDVATHCSCCKGIPAVVGSNDCRIWDTLLTFVHIIAMCYNIPGKLAPPILGPLGARCFTVGCETTCCARPSKAAQTKAGVCMLMYCMYVCETGLLRVAKTRRSLYSVCFCRYSTR